MKVIVESRIKRDYENNTMHAFYSSRIKSFVSYSASENVITHSQTNGGGSTLGSRWVCETSYLLEEL